MTIDYGFNSDDIKLNDFNLPIGKYKVMILSEEVKESKNENNPQYLAVTFEMLTGGWKGTKKTHNYNIYHTATTTRKIAQQDIAKIAKATGSAVNETSPLKNRVLVLAVTANKKNDDFVDIKYYPATENCDETPFD